MGTATAMQLTEAQWRVLRTFVSVGRCVGDARTDESTGFVNVTAARSLVALGLCSEEVGALGRYVFVISDAGRALLAETVGSAA